MNNIGLYNDRPVKRVILKNVYGNDVEYIPVILCKDCKHYQKNTCPKRAWAYTEPDDFCSDGEKLEVI